MQIPINPNTYLELIATDHAPMIYEMVDSNREHLRTWLPFVDRMKELSFAENFVRGTIVRNETGAEYAFMIYHNKKPVGRIGVYKIDMVNRSGEIGYWLIADAQSKGIVSNAVNGLLDFCFEKLNLHRIEIRCAVENYKSQAIPEKLGFTKEGIIREGEWLGDHFTDLILYSLLKKEKLSASL